MSEWQRRLLHENFCLSWQISFVIWRFKWKRSAIGYWGAGSSRSLPLTVFRCVKGHVSIFRSIFGSNFSVKSCGRCSFAVCSNVSSAPVLPVFCQHWELRSFENWIMLHLVSSGCSVFSYFLIYGAAKLLIMNAYR